MINSIKEPNINNIENHKYICTICGHHTSNGLQKPCEYCGSFKLALVSVIIDIFGETYKTIFK